MANTRSRTVYTNSQLQKAFAMVQPKTHWKDRIDALIPESADHHAIAEAITHFTGSVAEFTAPVNGMVRVRAAGYWMTIGA